MLSYADVESEFPIMTMTSPSWWKKFAKTVFLAYLCALCLVTLISGLYIESHYSAVMPRNPQPETGRIYPIWFKTGGTVYVNQWERERSDFVKFRLFPLFGLSMLVGVGMGIHRGWWDSGPKGPYREF